MNGIISLETAVGQKIRLYDRLRSVQVEDGGVPSPLALLYKSPKDTKHTIIWDCMNQDYIDHTIEDGIETIFLDSTVRSKMDVTHIQFKKTDGGLYVPTVTKEKNIKIPVTVTVDVKAGKTANDYLLYDLFPQFIKYHTKVK